MMNKIILVSIFIVLVYCGIPWYTAQTLGTFQKDECISLPQTCDNCTYVNISNVIYPNSSIALGQVEMTKVGTYYNYSFCRTNVSGIYIVNTFGDDDGFTTSNSYDFIINPQGIESTQQRTDTLSRAVYFMFGIGILLFIGFLFYNTSPPIRWTLFIFAITFFLIGLNLIGITLADEVINPQLESFFDGFTAISFIFYWFAAGLLIILWLFTALNTWIYKKNMANAARYI